MHQKLTSLKIYAVFGYTFLQNIIREKYMCLSRHAMMPRAYNIMTNI